MLGWRWVARCRLFFGPRSGSDSSASTFYVNRCCCFWRFGIQTGRTVYFETALIIALLGFVGTVALAKFLMRGEVIE